MQLEFKGCIAQRRQLISSQLAKLDFQFAGDLKSSTSPSKL